MTAVPALLHIAVAQNPPLPHPFRSIRSWARVGGMDLPSAPSLPMPWSVGLPRTTGPDGSCWTRELQVCFPFARTVTLHLRQAVYEPTSHWRSPGRLSLHPSEL